MKLLFGVTAILALASCKKETDAITATTLQPVIFIQDCTGSYLRYDSTDYPVCNRGIMKAYSDGDSLKAAFTQIDSCQEGPYVVCAMVHPYPTGKWIRINRVE